VVAPAAAVFQGPARAELERNGSVGILDESPGLRCLFNEAANIDPGLCRADRSRENTNGSQSENWCAHGSPSWAQYTPAANGPHRFPVWVFLFVANAFFLFFRQFRTLPKPGHSTSKFIFRPYPALFKHLSPATRLQPK